MECHTRFASVNILLKVVENAETDDGKASCGISSTREWLYVTPFPSSTNRSSRHLFQSREGATK